MRQIAAVVALIGGYFAACRYTDLVLPWTNRFAENPRLAFALTFVLVFIVVALGFTLLGKLMQKFMQITLMGWVDRISGLLIGGVKAVIVTCLVYMFLSSTLSSTNTWLRKSVTGPYLQQGSELLRSWINDPKIREYFAQKQPAILPNIPTEQKPSQEESGQKTQQQKHVQGQTGV